MRPNGSRLSCGASARRRKRPALRDLPAGAQTHASSESQPRQLQALVRRRRCRVELRGTLCHSRITLNGKVNVLGCRDGPETLVLADRVDPPSPYRTESLGTPL